MPVWRHKPFPLFLSSIFTAFSPSNCLFHAPPHSLPVSFLPHFPFLGPSATSQRNVYEPSLKLWPEPPCPYVSVTWCIFPQPPVSMPESNWPTRNISRSPTRQPPPSPPRRAQPRLPVCSAVLCSTRSSALSAGDRLFGIYPLLLCLSLHLQPFMEVKKQSLLPLIHFLPSPPLPSPNLQLNSFHHPPTSLSPPPPPPSLSTISFPNPVLLKTVIEQRGMLGLGLLLKILSKCGWKCGQNGIFCHSDASRWLGNMGSRGKRGLSIQRRGQPRKLQSLDPCSDKVELQVTAHIQQTDRKSILL